MIRRAAATARPTTTSAMRWTSRCSARAQRRKLQLEEKGVAGDLATILREIEERDRNDAAREHSPLRKAKDAIEVETTNTSIDEQVSMILSLVVKRIEQVQKGWTA